MSIPAQGAVGAGSVPLNLEALSFLYRLACSHPAAEYETARRIDAANATLSAALASPRADSDERTAGAPSFATAWDPATAIATAVMRLPWAFQGADSCDAVCNRHGEVQELAHSVLSLRPAQPAGAVPDSLRALSEAATKGEWYAANGTDIRARGALGAPIGMTSPAGDGNGLNDRAFVIALANWFRILLASHPAGQSAVSGAAWIVTNGETGDDLRFRMWSGRAWVWTSSLSQAAHFARKGDARQILPDGDEHGERVEPAPDSTRTDQGEAEELREEVAYWRRDLSARIWAMTAHYKGALERGEGIRASEIGNDLRAALASFHDAQAKDWYERCDICGEHIRDGEPTAASEDVSGHARCVSEDGEGAVYPHGEEDLAAQVRAAQAALAEPWPDAALAARPAAPEAQGASPTLPMSYHLMCEEERRLHTVMEVAATWHDDQAKALSKQPPGGARDWQRLEHEEQARLLREDRIAPPASSGQGGR